MEKSTCVNVDKVYDWINIYNEIQECVEIPLGKIRSKGFTDCLCVNFKLTENYTREVLWENIDLKGVATTFSIKNASRNPMTVYVNDEMIGEIQPNDTFNATISNTKTIAVDSSSIAFGTTLEGCLNLTINYYFSNKKKQCIDPKEIFCYLSDIKGNRLSEKDGDMITCEEVKSEENRKFIRRPGFNLNKVRIKVSGYISFGIIIEGSECILCTIPFCLLETVLLCAPPGTELKFNICDLECINCGEFEVSGDCAYFIVSISYTLGVQSVTPVTIELESNSCNPRELYDKCFFNP